MGVLLLQMCEAQVESGGAGILSGPVWPVGKLEGVKCGGEFEDDMFLYQPLEALLWFLWHWDDGRCIET